MGLKIAWSLLLILSSTLALAGGRLIVVAHSSYDENVNKISYKMVKRLKKDYANNPEVKVKSIDVGQNVMYSDPVFGRTPLYDDFDSVTVIFDTHGVESSSGFDIQVGDGFINVNELKLTEQLAKFAPNAKEFHLILATCHAGAFEVNSFPKPLTVLGLSPKDGVMTSHDIVVFLNQMKYLRQPIPLTAVDWFNAWYKMAETFLIGQDYQYISDHPSTPPMWLAEFDRTQMKLKVIKGVKDMATYKGRDKVFRALIKHHIQFNNEVYGDFLDRSTCGRLGFMMKSQREINRWASEPE